jgi:cellulose synthase/poly-beta-1,6-N-acetylglucosamine synthase-like glycosyltransferase
MISLVSTIRNDRAGAELFFRRMAEQTRPPDEIVIVDSLSRDGTWDVLQTELGRPDRAWRLVAWQERCNVARGRNLAISRAAHELIASTDIGCDWDPQWLAELVQPFEADPACQAVMGSWSVREQDLTSVWARVEYSLLQQPKLVATSRSDSSSRSIAYTRTLWRKIGGYPEDLTLAGDDLAYAFLLHHFAPPAHVHASPIIRCHWERPATLRAFLKEARRNFRGAGEAGIFLAHSIKVGGRMLMEAVLFLFGSVWLTAWGEPWPALIAWAFAGVSFAGRVSRLRAAVATARRLEVPQPFWRLLFFEYATKLWGMIGFWEGFLRGTKQCRDCRRRLRQIRSNPSPVHDR